MKQFKIRCSAIGQIMANSRTKGQLSKTAQSYCQDWLKEQIYERRKDFSNKYTEKGNIMEDNSLDFIAEHLDYGMLIKNEEYFENEFLTGTPDVVLDDHLIDVKNSWDCFTFPLFFNAVPNKDYYYQAQGYMALTGRKSYKLIYTLMDTPEHLVEKEFRFNNPNQLNEIDFFAKYKYGNIAPKHRIKVFEIERNDEDIANIEARVNECRNYINQIR